MKIPEGKKRKTQRDVCRPYSHDLRQSRRLEKRRPAQSGLKWTLSKVDVNPGRDSFDGVGDPLFPERLYIPGTISYPYQPWKQNMPGPRNVVREHSLSLHHIPTQCGWRSCPWELQLPTKTNTWEESISTYGHGPGGEVLLKSDSPLERRGSLKHGPRYFLDSP